MKPVLLALLLVASAAADEQFGEPLVLDEPVAIKNLVSQPESYVGKKVQVEGKITEVCQMMGCWMMLHDGAGSAVRIKVHDGVIEFPKDSAGRTARAEGEFVKHELSRAQALASAKHEADEQGRKFDPSKVKGPTTFYEIQGSGAILRD